MSNLKIGRFRLTKVKLMVEASNSCLLHSHMGGGYFFASGKLHQAADARSPCCIASADSIILSPQRNEGEEYAK